MSAAITRTGAFQAALGAVLIGLPSDLPAVPPLPPSGAINISDIEATNLDGTTFHGAELAGKTVLLDFWAVWCGPCITAIPALKDLSRELEGQNFEVVGIASYSGTVDDVRESVDRHAIDYKVVLAEPELVVHFGVIGFPTYMLMAPNGSIHDKYVGTLSKLTHRIRADVLALAGGLGAPEQTATGNGKDQ
ncbi:MAG: TlpA disulfide reductase family protein [Candidatus Neomarinimicrobiota bacterium]